MQNTHDQIKTIKSLIGHINQSDIARMFGINRSAVFFWIRDNRLPLTDLAGITDYAQRIEQRYGVSAEDMISVTRETAFKKRQKNHQALAS